MKAIDKTKPVVVTGANGFVASWLVKKLLEEGITVHAAVRNPENEKKVGHLKKVAESSPGNIKFFKTDLLAKGSYKEAMQGCELVFHTASPFINSVKDPIKDLIEPAEKGTENVLETAKEVDSVKRVVLTSSCVAVYGDNIDSKNIPGGILTEDNWNTTSTKDHVPYSYSKTLAEKKAWEIASTQNNWDLITINPSFVMGPPLNPLATTSESFNILKQVGDGTFSTGMPKIGMGIVDVRDVAEAHFLAGYTPDAQGRYITSGHNSDLFSMTLNLKEKYGAKFPLPKMAAPKWLLMLIGPMVDKSITRKYVKNNVNIPLKLDNSKIKRDLKIKFRPLKESMEDGFQALIDANVLQPKN
jgi:nucleoside-diphosphate-sugar epimerase